MSDFELAIINAGRGVFPHVAISTCFFHFRQNLHRKIQEFGLQVMYNDVNDRRIKSFTQMLAALAFVPIGDVECYFAALKETAPPKMMDFVEYFDNTYVTGKKLTYLSTLLKLLYIRLNSI